MQDRGVELKSEQLPITAMVRSPLLAICWREPNQPVAALYLIDVTKLIYHLGSTYSAQILDKWRIRHSIQSPSLPWSAHECSSISTSPPLSNKSSPSNRHASRFYFSFKEPCLFRSSLHSFECSDSHRGASSGGCLCTTLIILYRSSDGYAPCQHALHWQAEPTRNVCKTEFCHLSDLRS